MVKLPFVVEPRRKPIMAKIGTEESGIIEVERRGYLTTGEKSFVQQVQQHDNGTSEIVTLSRQIARKFSLGMDRAYQLVLMIISGSEKDEPEELVNEIEAEFAEGLTEVVKGLAASKSREELVMAACMLRYRVLSNFDIGDIATIHPDIISGLAVLYQEEERQSMEAFEQQEEGGEATPPSVEEIEKKPRKTTGSRSTNTTGD
ncbi:MAG: hypothetical protein ACO24H_05255 [Polynucleobacter sp.]